MYRILTGRTTPGQGRPGSNGNERVLHIPQSSRTGVLPSDGLITDSGYFMEVRLTPQQRCSQCILQPQPAGLWCNG